MKVPQAQSPWSPPSAENGQVMFFNGTAWIVDYSYTKNQIDTLLADKSATTHNHSLAGLSEKAYDSLTGKPTIPASLDDISDGATYKRATAAQLFQQSEITTVGTIGTGVWNGTALTANYVPNHDSLNGFVADEHIDWTAPNTETIYALSAIIGSPWTTTLQSGNNLIFSRAGINYFTLDDIGSIYYQAGTTKIQYLSKNSTIFYTAGVARMTIASDGGITFHNIPTSDPGVAGEIWNNSGVLNISAG